MALPPQPVVFNVNKLKWVLIFALCAACTAVGIMMIKEEPVKGWFVTVVCSLGAVVGFLLCLPSSGYLRLDQEGFTICSLFRSHKYSWRDVTSFGVCRVRSNKMIGFNFVPGYERSKKMRKLSVYLSGFEAALPDTYGHSLDQLVQMMNEWRGRYGN